MPPAGAGLLRIGGYPNPAGARLREASDSNNKPGSKALQADGTERKVGWGAKQWPRDAWVTVVRLFFLLIAGLDGAPFA